MKKHILHLSLAAAVLVTACQPQEKQTTNGNNEISNGMALENATLEGDETITTPYGEITLTDNYISDESSEKLFNAMDLQRASQAYIWSTPLVSITTWRDNQGEVYGSDQFGTFAVLQSFNEKLGIVTANLTTPYIFSFANLSNGVLEIDYPVGQTAGGILDFWQRPVADLGLTGPDQGKGGKYIIVGPEEDLSKYKKDGVFLFQSATNNILIATRIINPDPAFSKKFQSELGMTQGGTKADIKFTEGLDKAWSATAPRGLDYWKKLSDIINDEPVREQDKVWLAMLEPLGIDKGKDFNPNERQTKILLKGAAIGELMARNNQINPRFTKPYWEGTYWYKSFDFTTAQETDIKVQLDERATWFYEAVGSSEGMVNPVPGKGQVYMTSKRDKNGKLLRADKTYKLRVPKDVPVGQFWSITLYSENTRRAYENGTGTIRGSGLNSRLEDLVVNEDGSIDIYIGPKAPEGFEKNHLKTVGDDGWFIYFRLYAPLEPFFDKSFQLPDWEMID
ncbi:DUF1254 domain-containing protein [Echinicola sp. CAU 1574]|uniref:DUF1254 domain-containing protein n=1 Tax=Echinicola arenosa TaxID=2774144 RepID=A0ABR9AKZ2_9BACT|nr:DUF1214 domain-containing protein [Echinicola arenosa]MBD8489466.1 DUF1254 domain-containing protein [Echinicola arenosa]